MSDIKKLKDSVYELEGLLELADRRPGKLGVLIPLVEARIEALTNMFYELKPNVGLSVENVAPAQQPEEDKPVAIAEPVSAVEPEEPGESGETGDDVEELYVIDDAGPAESVVSVEPQLTVAAAPAAASVRRPVFCLNDRFRFRRALFGGSDAEFNAVLDRVASMSGMEEVEDYIYGTLGLEPDSDDTADFMETVRTYFES